MPAYPAIDPLTVVRDHQVRIWRYLRSLGCSTADAEDLAQETFLSVLQRPFEDRGPAATAAYLQTVARNLFLKSRRTRGLRQVDVDLDQTEKTWHRLCEADGGDAYLDALQQCIAALDGRGRDALLMRYEQDASRSAIAERLGVSSDGVKSLLRRVRQGLRDCVERRIG